MSELFPQAAELEYLGVLSMTEKRGAGDSCTDWCSVSINEDPERKKDQHCDPQLWPQALGIDQEHEIIDTNGDKEDLPKVGWAVP